MIAPTYLGGMSGVGGESLPFLLLNLAVAKELNDLNGLGAKRLTGLG